MECPNCGATIRDNAVFCSSCGQRITSQSMQTPTPPQADAWETSGRGGGTAGAPWQATGAAEPGGVGRAGAGLGGRRARPGAAGPDVNALTGRLRRLARLDTSVFRDARDDPAALVPSLIVAGVAILLMALGGWLWEYFKFGDFPFYDSGRNFVREVIFGTILGFGLWVAWVWLTSVVLTQLFKRPADWLALLRPMGLAAAPIAVGLLMFIDIFHLGLGVGAVTAGALLSQIALQESTDATPGEAFVANMAGFALWALALSWLGHDSANLAPGIWPLG